MVYYNLTNVTSGNTTMLSFTRGVNDVLMHGMLGIGILLGLWAVIFISVMATSNDATKAGLTSSFITFALALTLAALNLIPDLAIFIPLIIAGFIVAFSWR